ncbi:MAG TPA: TrkA family potassium uptake protein [Caldilineaceae bacterium]|nr:TrkA family potassium uptake protein [Caldilineaceae bacterium]
MRALIIGCGRAGAELANRLARAGHWVTVIDVAAEAFDNLAPDFRGHAIEAEALNRDVLVNAGIREADCVATLTNSDALNAVIGHLARTEFHVPRVVVRNYDPRYAPLHEAFGLQSVNSVQWNASRFEELLVHPQMPVIQPIGDGRVAIYELNVPVQLAGIRLAELAAAGDAIIAGVIRQGESHLPSPDLVLEAGDVLTVSATAEGAARLRVRLGEGA